MHSAIDGRGRPCTGPDVVIADKGYSSGTIRRQFRKRNIAAVTLCAILTWVQHLGDTP
ncbi:hypothetical protein [Corynebacterium sp. CCM 9204]|uniref:hypothetical protein n=1 Tax=Corynebacterium sp. CCM 9204 TaxID=3057616 RepID=UPI0035263389